MATGTNTILHELNEAIKDSGKDPTDADKVREWFGKYTSKGYLYEYIIEDDAEIEFISDNMHLWTKDQKLVLFDNSKWSASGLAAVTAASLVFFPIAIAAAQFVAYKHFTGGLAGGILRHMEVLEEKDKEITKAHAELFLELYTASGFDEQEKLIYKILLHISKKIPELTFDEVKILGDDFGWTAFNEKATGLINEYLDSDPNVPKESKINHEIIFPTGLLDWDEYYFPYKLSIVLTDIASTLAISAVLDVATDENPGIRTIMGWMGYDAEILGDVKIAKAFKSTLVPLFFQEPINYTFPFKDAAGDNLENLRNTIRISGPLSTAKLSGGFSQFETVGRLFNDFFSRAGYLGVVEEAYVEFLKFALSDLNSVNGDLNKSQYYGTESGSWQEHFNKSLNGLVDRVKENFAVEILNALRFDTWKNLAEELNDIEDPVAGDINKLLPKAFNKAQREFEEGHGNLVGDATEKALSEEEIASRQKFIKQCALMSNFTLMKEINRDLIINKIGIHNPNPYGNRFYLLDDTDQRSSIPNKLLLPSLDKIKPILEMTPDIHAFLIPKIRLFKVFNREDGTLDQFEFLFRNFVSSKRVNNFGETFDKGDGAGIKSFSFSFEGTNPAVSRNDITAKLSLFFQSFDDFIKDRLFPGNDKKHAYVDLILHPVSDKKKGPGVASFLQYDPSYYRIRADVGWVVDNTNNEQLKQVLKNRSINYNKFKTALRTINKSFYLNMVDHDLNINDDGTVTINADFRAYMESAMKSSTLDILSTPTIKEQRNALQTRYQEILKENKCTAEELNKIKITMNQISEELIKKSYRSLMKRMVERRSLLYVTADGASMNSYATNGYLSEPVKLIMTPLPQLAYDENESPATAAVGNPVVAEKNTHYTLDVTFKDVPLQNGNAWKTINFFFLGDLLYTLMDCAYAKDGTTYANGAENLKLLLSSFDYDNLYDVEGRPAFANIADIPISAEYFFEWYTENVIKKEKQTYPIMTFIRDICNHLISNILLESCFKVSYDKTMRFQTGNFLANSRKGDVFLTEVSDEYRPDGVYDVKAMYQNNILPFENESEGASVAMKDYYNYIFLYAVSPATSHQGRGIKSKDGESGIYHYQLGASKGLMKKVKFSKTDIQYLREARFFRNGHDGLMQLGNVYKVTMEMIGNTIYYPGMQFYIDPKGIGKGRQFDPTIGPAEGVKGSIANALGLGGYHLVTRVNSELASGKFNTTVEGMFVYSGDGNPAKIAKGGATYSKITTTKIDKKGDGTCPNTLNQVVNMFRDVKTGNHGSIFKKITEGTMTAQEQAVDAVTLYDDNESAPAEKSDPLLEPKQSFPLDELDEFNDLPGESTP